MEESSVRSAVERLVDGDISQVSAVRSVRHADLRRACRDTRYEVTGTAVVKVLRAHAAGDVPESDIQWWASFVRRGYAERMHEGPIRPLSIGYEEAHELGIAEAVGRLDELGDDLDGEMDAEEVRALLRALTKE
jgi:hypothetical protein